MIDSSFVYAIFIDGFCKVGHSRYPRKRMSEVQVGCPMAIRHALIVRLPTKGMALNVEATSHARLAAFHSSGEWFRTDDRAMVITTVREVATDLSGGLATFTELDLEAHAAAKTAKRTSQIKARGPEWQRKRRETTVVVGDAPPAPTTFRRRRFQRH